MAIAFPKHYLGHFITFQKISRPGKHIQYLNDYKNPFKHYLLYEKGWKVFEYQVKA